MVQSRPSTDALQAPEDPGLKPAIGTFYVEHSCVLQSVDRRDKNKEKEIGNGHIFMLQ